MEKLKLLIADMDAAFTDQLSHFLHRYPDIEIVAIDHDGRDALTHIRSSQPDAVLFDLLLPGIDGISLLRSIQEMPSPPASICCTRFYTDIMLEAARTNGASYVLFKPLDIYTLYPVIVSSVELNRSLRRGSISTGICDGDSTVHSGIIRNYIVSLGVPSKLVGCTYLVEAVQRAQADMSLIQNLSKGLYLEIARAMSTTPTRIERCIRNAISAAYQKSELRLRMPSCPTNKEFINYILRNLPE